MTRGGTFKDNSALSRSFTGTKTELLDGSLDLDEVNDKNQGSTRLPDFNDRQDSKGSIDMTLN